MIVVDASVLANVIADDGPDGQLARREVRNDGDISVPDLVDVETLAVLRKRWLAGTISDRRFVAAIDDLDALELGRYPTLPLVPRGYDLRANVSAYDAMYVALAEELNCQLLTRDRRLAGAPGPQCAIRLLQ